MKKQTLIAICLFAFSLISQGQITLEQTYKKHVYSYSPTYNGVSIINLSISGKKIIAKDSGAIRLYNLDHSLWKTVPFPKIQGFFPTDAQYIAENLFKLDNKVYATVQYWNYDPSVPNPIIPSGGWKSKYVIFDENSSILAVIDSVYNRTSVSIYNLDDKTSKMVVGIYNDSSMQTLDYKVFSLPGTLSCSPCSSGNTAGIIPPNNTENNSFIQAYPNPNKGQARINYTLPENTSHGKIILYNTNGQIIKIYEVDPSSQYIMLENAILPSGIYYYSLITDDTIVGGKKMVILQ